MKTEIKVTFENNYVKIITNGEHNFDIAKKIWSTADETCVSHNCYKILGIANTTKPLASIINQHHENTSLFYSSIPKYIHFFMPTQTKGSVKSI